MRESYDLPTSHLDTVAFPSARRPSDERAVGPGQDNRKISGWLGDELVGRQYSRLRTHICFGKTIPVLAPVITVGRDGTFDEIARDEHAEGLAAGGRHEWRPQAFRHMPHSPKLVRRRRLEV